MGLKNKDGTPYKLSSPNPIMSQMAMWDRSEKLILHNLGGRVINHQETMVDFEKKIEPKIVSSIEPRKPPVEAEKPDEFDIPIVETVEEEQEATSDIEKVKVWCLPAKGEKYGDKFLFEAILDEETDLQILLYTTTESVTEGSVLFPKTHDKRWWRVSETIKGDDGLIRVVGTITHYQPEFS